MRKLWLLALLIAIACASTMGGIVLTAQSLPSTRHVTWSQPDAVTAAVTGYSVQLDAAAPATFPPCAPDPTACDVTVTIATAGAHTLTEFATNTWGNGPSTVLTFTVVLPTKSGNLTIK